MSHDFDYIVLPGIYGSDEDHWQTMWEQEDAAMRRLQPSSWDFPRLEDWKAALTSAVEESRQPVVLVAHSLANILVGHWALTSELARTVAGAFLVSLPDPSGPRYPRDARDFVRPPKRPLPFRSLLVASDDDPFGDLGYTREMAQAWGSGLIVFHGWGHVNSESGLGRWATGRDLLTAFVAGL